jgi:hypothetical protein
MGAAYMRRSGLRQPGAFISRDARREHGRHARQGSLNARREESAGAPVRGRRSTNSRRLARATCSRSRARSTSINNFHYQKQKTMDTFVSTPGYHRINAEKYHADPCVVPSLSSSIAKILLRESARKAWFSHPRLNPDSLRERGRQVRPWLDCARGIARGRCEQRGRDRPDRLSEQDRLHSGRLD